MDDEERYFFDLNGYLVVENALSSEEVAACNEAIDRNAHRIRERSGEQSLSGKSRSLKGLQGRGDLGGMLTWPKPWCQPFRDLLAHPSIVPYLNEVLREGFRLDHVYGIIMRKGTEGHVLHGGGTTDDLTHFYQFHNGRNALRPDGCRMDVYRLRTRGRRLCVHSGEPQIELSHAPGRGPAGQRHRRGAAGGSESGFGRDLHRSPDTRDDAVDGPTTSGVPSSTNTRRAR